MAWLAKMLLHDAVIQHLNDSLEIVNISAEGRIMFGKVAASRFTENLFPNIPLPRGDSTMSQNTNPVKPLDQRACQEDLQIGLMLRVKQGDGKAFDELVRNHWTKVVFTAAKMLSCHSEAEDIAQQVFVQVWKSAGRYEPKAKFETWLSTIIRNLVFNEKRRQKRKPTVSMDESGIDYFDRIKNKPHSISPRDSSLYF